MKINEIKKKRNKFFFLIKAFLMVIYAEDGTMQFLKLHNMKQIYIISDESFVSELFIGSVSILNVLASQLILSMCTRLLDIFLSSITVAHDILFFFLKNVGVFIWIFLCNNISWTAH